jgi:hypothetical protein
MAKESGLGWTTFAVDNSAGSPNNIRNDTTQINWSIPRAVQDITGLDKSARETLLLLADFSFTATGVFNDASNLSHDTFKTVSSSTVVRTVTNTVSGNTLACECNLTDYALNRAATGEFTWSVPGVLADGTAPSWA